MMTCDEFEALGLDLNRNPARRAEAEEHLGSCARCAAWLESCQELRADLRALARETEILETPMVVELALREVVRAQRPQPRQWMPKWAWGLTAATVVALITWLSWSLAGPMGPTPGPSATQVAETPSTRPSPAPVGLNGGVAAPVTPARHPAAENVAALTAADDGFVALPYAVPSFAEDDSSVVRVRMQRAGLGALGLPVNEERAGEWVMVDLLVGVDGEAQAVRLLR